MFMLSFSIVIVCGFFGGFFWWTWICVGFLCCLYMFTDRIIKRERFGISSSGLTCPQFYVYPMLVLWLPTRYNTCMVLLCSVIWDQSLFDRYFCLFGGINDHCCFKLSFNNYMLNIYFINIVYRCIYTCCAYSHITI